MTEEYEESTMSLQEDQCKIQWLLCPDAQQVYTSIIEILKIDPLMHRELDLSEKVVPGDPGVARLATLLKDPHCRTTKLRLRKCRITSKGLNVLLSAVHPSHLTELDLSENAIGGSRLKKLLDILQSPSFNLQTLGLCNCSLTKEDCAALFSALHKNPSTLIDLNLNRNKIGSEAVKKLSELLKHPNCNLQKLGLSACSIKEKGYNCLAEALKSNSQLMVLDLRGNSPGKSDTKKLQYSIKQINHNLNLLLLEEIPEIKEACNILRRILGTEDPLQQCKLDLSEQINGDEEIKELSALLKDQHCTVTTLKLSNCKITSEGCSALTSALRSNPLYLKELDLSGNSIKDQGVKMISDLLKMEECSMQKLVLSDCSIREGGYKSLASALKLNPSSELRELDLRGNDPGESGVKSLTDLKNAKLKELRFLKRTEAVEAAESLALTLGQNPLLLKEMTLMKEMGIEGDSTVKKLTWFLQDSHCKLNKLTITDDGITKESCADLATVLISGSCTLTELNLKSKILGNYGVKHLCTALKTPACELKSLGLSDCGITGEGYTFLAEAISSNLSSSLIKLDLSGNDPGELGVKNLTEVFVDSSGNRKTLKFLRTEAETAFKFLKTVLNKDPLLLTELDLSDKKTERIEVKQLSALLVDSHFRLQKLTLYKKRSVNELDIAEVIEALFKNPSHLQELNLNGNKPGKTGLEFLCDLLKNQQCKLRNLWLSQCSLTDESCTSLSSALNKNPSHLRELDLSQNEVKDSGIKKLCDVLNNQKFQLQTLRLNQCLITDEGCTDLRSALSTNPSHLRELELRNNKLTDSVRHLSEVLPECKVIYDQSCLFSYVIKLEPKTSADQELSTLKETGYLTF